jgi:PAS domain S-box-containing protein
MPIKLLRTSLSRQKALFFALLVFFIGTLLFLSVALSRSFQSFTQKKIWLRELHTNLNDLTKLEAGLANSESKFRAFLLSGDSIWWRQLAQERIHFTQTAAQLRKVTAITPLMDSITKTAAIKFALENELAARLHNRYYSLQQHRQEVSKQFAPSSKRIKLGNHIRQLLDKAQTRQKATIIAGRKLQDRLQPVIIWQFAAIILLIVLLMLFLMNKAYQGMAQRARSTALMQTLLASAHDGFYLLNSSWRILLMNQKAKTYLHASLGVIPQQGNNLLELLPEKDRQKIEQLYEQALAGEQIIRKHSLLIEGRPCIIELQHRAVFDKDLNKNIGISILLRDITEQTGAEEARRKSEATRRMIMNAVQDAVICIDKEGKISYWNNKAEIIFGWTKKEAIGLTLDKTIIPEYHRSGHKAGFDYYHLTGKHRIMNKLVELTAVNKDGHNFPIEMYVLL